MFAPMPSALIQLPLLDDTTASRLNRFLDIHGSRQGDRKALLELYGRMSSNLAKGVWPTSVSELFGTSKSPGYKRFTRNAEFGRSRAETERWADAVFNEPALLTRQAVLLDLVSTNWAGGGGWVLKAALLLGGGLQPVDVKRTYVADHRVGLVVNLLTRLKKAGHHVPILTTRPDAELASLMLELSVRLKLDWTGRVSSQFAFPPQLAVRALHSAPMQTLNVAEILAASDTDFAWVEVNKAHYFLLFGPSPQGRYYIKRHTRKGEGVSEQADLLRLIQRIEADGLGLSDFAVERLRVLKKCIACYESLTQGKLWLWRFALYPQLAPSIQHDGDAHGDEAKKSIDGTRQAERGE